jgi:RNA polymerase sigma-70 factor (ECF subfamily)
MAPADGDDGTVRDRDVVPVRDQIVSMLPNLRAFARTLASDAATADDLVQDTVVKAFNNLHRFEVGTNLHGWLFTILRNTFYSDLRKRRGVVEDVDGTHAEAVIHQPSQYAKLDARDFRKAMAMLACEQREALILVGPAGFSYEEAADVCGCAVGTIKSRVNRARERLNELLNSEHDDGGAERGEAHTAGVASAASPACEGAAAKAKG